MASDPVIRDVSLVRVLNIATGEANTPVCRWIRDSSKQECLLHLCCSTGLPIGQDLVSDSTGLGDWPVAP